MMSPAANTTPVEVAELFKFFKCYSIIFVKFNLLSNVMDLI